MSKKWQTAVYQIHSINEYTKELYKFLDNKSNDYNKKLEYLKRLVYVDEHPYIEQKLKILEENNMELFLFYRLHPKESPNWKTFFASEIKDDEDIHTKQENMHESFVFFLYHKISNKLYAICGGYGSLTIQKYIDDEFGINILIRLLEKKEDKVLVGAKEFGITGGIIGMSKNFRSEYNFYENKNFGNIYREISARLNKNILKNLSISSKIGKQCIAKSSFKLSKSIKYNEMIELVSRLDTTIQKKENFIVNDIKLIKEKTFIQSIERHLVKEIWKNKNEKLSNYIDFIHKDFENFFKSEKYTFLRRKYDFNHKMIDDIFEKVNKNSLKELVNDLKNKYITTHNSENKKLTKGSILNHIIYEFDYKKQSYFLINNDFYQITTNFKDTLNESCQFFIKNNLLPVNKSYTLNKVWKDDITEKMYNKLYLDDDKTIVLDTIVPENIESCDILKYDDNKVYLYHVKKGFNGSMRDLTNQVFISASRMQNDIKTDKSYLTSLYNKMKSSEEDYSKQNISKEDFLNIFDKELCFIVAIKDTGTSKRSLKNIKSFSSSIAKFALNELVNNMRNINTDLKIIQIK